MKSIEESAKTCNCLFPKSSQEKEKMAELPITFVDAGGNVGMVLIRLQ
tara:strand:- start:1536 stop:1679 length:144 start_codon:yes stop_codon:yes gene_type:complete